MLAADQAAGANTAWSAPEGYKGARARQERPAAGLRRARGAECPGRKVPICGVRLDHPHHGGGRAPAPPGVAVIRKAPQSWGPSSTYTCLAQGKVRCCPVPTPSADIRHPLRLPHRRAKRSAGGAGRARAGRAVGLIREQPAELTYENAVGKEGGG